MKVLVKEGGYFYKRCISRSMWVTISNLNFVFKHVLFFTLICLVPQYSLKIKSSTGEVVPLVSSHNSGWLLLRGLT